jgi:alpha-ribazole phosphatase
MVTTLYLIRHGETEGGPAKRYYGSIDVPLSEKGIAQVRRTSAFIEKHLRSSSSLRYFSYLREIDKPKELMRNSGHKENSTESAETGTSQLSAVYCSDLGRAVKSAEIIAEPHGLKAVTVHGLRERSFGIWEGMTFTEIKERYPVDFDLWAADPVKHTPIKGETTVAVRDRVMTEMGQILNNHAGDSVAVVAHGGVNRIILCHILGIPLENIFRVEQDHGTVNIIEFWNRYPVAKLINFRPN